MVILNTKVFNTKNILKIQKYTTQMNFRINEGNGEAIYLQV